MAENGGCPVCGFKGASPTMDECPQCHADLACFKALDALGGAHAPPAAAPDALRVELRKLRRKLAKGLRPPPPPPPAWPRWAFPAALLVAALLFPLGFLLHRATLAEAAERSQSQLALLRQESANALLQLRLDFERQLAAVRLDAERQRLAGATPLREALENLRRLLAERFDQQAASLGDFARRDDEWRKRLDERLDALTARPPALSRWKTIDNGVMSED